MKIEKNYLENHQLELRVEANPEAFEKTKYQTAKRMAKNTKIPGYRPGKAPYQLIVNHFGEGAILDRALDDFLDDIYPDILDQADLKPYGPGQVKEIPSLDPPTFVFEIPLQPKVELGEYQEIRLPYQPGIVDEEEVDQVIKRLRTQQAAIEPVDHPAEVGCLVDTSISGFPADADPEDESKLLLNQQPLPVMIKEEAADTQKEWPFPGFSRQMLGVSAGDVLDLSHEYPDEESVDEAYRGKDVLFKVEVEGIRQRVLPELDSEFIKSISDAETLEEFKTQIRQDLENRQNIEEEEQYLNQIFEEIMDISDVKYPSQMMEDEIEGEIKEIEARLQNQGMDLETYLAAQDQDEESLREDLRPRAELRIERGLLIGKISEEAELDITTEEITSEYQRVLEEHFGEEEDQKEAFQKSQESLSLLNQISSQIISRKTVDYLIALAKGEDVTPFLKSDAEQEEKEDGEQEETKDQEADSNSITQEASPEK